jgi:DNA polymerase-4
MNRLGKREIVHVDIAAFAVAVERLVHPELRGRPVVVAPIGRSRSLVTAVSPEAWEAGIRKGMLMSKAVRYCRDVVVLPPNEPLYARASCAVYKVLADFSPVLEPSGYGHVYLDVTGTGRLLGPPRDIAWRAQREILRQLRLEASLGVAANKMVSKIASVVTKPVGLRDVNHGDEPSFLAPLPVRLLPGVGPKTQELLAELNIRIIRDLASMEQQHLTLAFGNFGFLMHQRARGIDNTPVYSPRTVPALEQEAVLAEDSNDLDLLKTRLFELCERACERLRRKGQRAGRLELHVRYSDYREESGKGKISTPSQSSVVLCRYAGRLLERVLKRRTRVRGLYLRLLDLTHGGVQLDLFSDPEIERRTKLESAMDLLHSRYGPTVFVKAKSSQPRQKALARISHQVS